MYCSRCGTWVPAGEAACARCGMVPAEVPPGAARAVSPPAGGSGPDAIPAAAVRAVRYGGFWRRYVALFVDGLVFFFPNAILRKLAGLPVLDSFTTVREDDLGRWLALTAVSLLAAWWYCARMESSRWQGTLGQQLMGLRVTDVHGRRVSYARATGRFLAQVLSVMLCGVGYLFNLWTARRQTLQDMISGCVIVRADAVAPAAEPAAPVFAEQAP